MDEPKLTGGTEADRKEILRLHEKYIDVNTRFDWEGLTPLYSPAPDATYFNLNGHTYNGREHWLRLWKFYGQNVASTYWTPFDIGGVVTGDLARGVVPPQDAAAMDRQGAAAEEHQLRQHRVHLALDHGVPQGGWRVARGARAFLAG